MPSDVRIYDGAAWVSLKGPTGPAGPSAVSANAGQLAKLGTDNLVLVSSVDLDARYVNMTGDTMTGNLIISPAAAQLVVGGTGNTTQTLRSTDGGNATLNISAGTNTGQLVQTGTSFNFVNYASGGATSFSQTGNGLIRFFANSVQTLAISGTGISVAGNITSTGTAHNFQPNSILVNAISGLNADSLSDVTVTAPAAGQVLRWNGTNFVNAALNYSDLTGTAPGGTASTTAALADTSTGTVGTSTSFARADHTHPFPTAANVGAVALSGLSTVNGVLRLTSSSNTESVTVTLPSNFIGPNTGAISADTRSSSTSGYSNPVAAFYAINTGPAASPTSPKPNEYAFYSQGPAPSSLGGDLNVTGFITGSPKYIPLTSGRILSGPDRGCVLANVRTDAIALVITLPAADSGIPIGSRFEIVDLSVTSTTTVQAEPTVTLNYNPQITGGSSGGLGAQVSLAGPYSKATLYKTGTTNWVLISS